MSNDRYSDPQCFTRRTLPVYNDADGCGINGTNHSMNSSDHDPKFYTRSIPDYDWENPGNNVDEKNQGKTEGLQLPQTRTVFDENDIYLEQFLTEEKTQIQNQSDDKKQNQEQQIVVYNGDAEDVENEFQLVPYGLSTHYGSGEIRRRNYDSDSTLEKGNGVQFENNQDPNDKDCRYFTADEVFDDDDVADLYKDNLNSKDENGNDIKKTTAGGCWSRFKRDSNRPRRVGLLIQDPRRQFRVQQQVVMLSWVATMLIIFITSDCEFMMVADPNDTKLRGQGIFTEAIYNSYNDRIGCLRYDPVYPISLPMIWARFLVGIVLTGAVICCCLVMLWFLFLENMDLKRRIHKVLRLTYPTLLALSILICTKMNGIQECVLEDVTCKIGTAGYCGIASCVVFFLLTVLMLCIPPPGLPYFVINYKFLPSDDVDKYIESDKSQPLLIPRSQMNDNVDDSLNNNDVEKGIDGNEIYYEHTNNDDTTKHENYDDGEDDGIDVEYVKSAHHEPVQLGQDGRFDFLDSDHPSRTYGGAGSGTMIEPELSIVPYGQSSQHGAGVRSNHNSTTYEVDLDNRSSLHMPFQDRNNSFALQSTHSPNSFNNSNSFHQSYGGSKSSLPCDINSSKSSFCNDQSGPSMDASNEVIPNSAAPNSSRIDSNSRHSDPNKENRRSLSKSSLFSSSTGNNSHASLDTEEQESKDQDKNKRKSVKNTRTRKERPNKNEAGENDRKKVERKKSSDSVRSSKSKKSSPKVAAVEEDDDEFDYNDPTAKVRIETTMERVRGGMKQTDFIFRSDGKMITKEKFIPDEIV